MLQEKIEQLEANHQAEVSQLKSEMVILKSQAGHGGFAPGDPKKKNLKGLKGIADILTWSGKDLEFSDFEFKLHQFREVIPNFEVYMNYVKELEAEPTEQDIRVLHAEE